MVAVAMIRDNHVVVLREPLAGDGRVRVEII